MCVSVRTGVACVWLRAVCAECVCVYGTRLVSVRDASRASSWCEYEDFEDVGLVWVLIF